MFAGSCAPQVHALSGRVSGRRCGWGLQRVLGLGRYQTAWAILHRLRCRQIWAELHERAFRLFDGCPRYVVLDNSKEGLIKLDMYDPELTKVYAATLAHPVRVHGLQPKGYGRASH